MRKLYVSIIALMILGLFVSPVIASGDGDSEYQDVTVTIEECLEWESCENPIEFNICCDDYDDGISTPSNLPTGRTSLDVWSNVQWNVAISHDAYTNGMPADWDLETREDDDTDWMTLTETACNYFDSAMDPVDDVQYIFNYRITGISFLDTWDGDGDHEFQICYTVNAE